MCCWIYNTTIALYGEYRIIAILSDTGYFLIAFFIFRECFRREEFSSIFEQWPCSFKTSCTYCMWSRLKSNQNHWLYYYTVWFFFCPINVYFEVKWVYSWWSHQLFSLNAIKIYYYLINIIYRWKFYSLLNFSVNVIFYYIREDSQMCSF